MGNSYQKLINLSNDILEGIRGLDEAVDRKTESTSENSLHKAVESLNREVNSLQNNLAELGTENEFLNQSNKELSHQFTSLKANSGRLLETIKTDLKKIKTIINAGN